MPAASGKDKKASGRLRREIATRLDRTEATGSPNTYDVPVFRTRSPVKIFMVEKSLFSTFAAHLGGMCKINLGESYFLPNHNLIAIKQLQTAQKLLLTIATAAV